METLDRQEKEKVVGSVRGKYAAIALEGGSCCGPSGCSTSSDEAVTLDLGSAFLISLAVNVAASSVVFRSKKRAERVLS